ncbi:hypothetical protein [Vibrio spartinae]|uniref:Uncharacterized protein n=1 Tax=Vibrio spartinae TaxID=1918945 RepID=A0A1N6M7H3_9VIBR|nr:hypothetical protein [Vibrio spartinae]SIO95398.1 hypothetical protein VSP9026_03141 [Vibrio spartinae]
MDADKFTILVKEQARDFSVEWSEGDNVGVSAQAQEWLNNLSSQHKALLREVLEETVDISLIKLFEIMDGVHSSNAEPVEASIGNSRISGKGCSQLHDLYASKI